MKKTQFISMLGAKDDVQSSFLVKYIAKASGKDGRSYLNIILSDNSGEMEARKWQDADQVISKIKTGDIVVINGKMNAFQGRLQLIVNEISKLNEDQYELDHYIKKSNSAPLKMYDQLIEIVSTLEEVYVKELLLAVLNDYEIKRRLLVWQAGKSIHHAYQSGLLEHILSCTILGNTLSVHYNANRSYVIAGCILHDLCKIYELTEGPSVDYTEEGKLIGHLVKSLEILDHFASKIEHFPYTQKLHLKHILLSHHGEYEYGSPKIPHTSEAYLVHLIDLMDSKMNSITQIKEQDNNTGHWSGMIKHLDRIIYKNELPSFTSFVLPEKEKENEKDQKPTLGDKLKNFKLD